MISFECPKCTKKINAPDAAAGKRVACPGCKAPIEVPSEKAAAAAIAKPQAPKPVPPKPPAPTAPVAKAPVTPSFDDDFKLQPDPSLNDLGLNASAPPDPFGNAFKNYDPPTPESPYAPVSMPTPKAASGTALQLPSKRNYFALTIVRYALLVLAALVAIGWLFSVAMIGIAVLSNAGKPEAGVLFGGGIMYLAVTFFSGAITCCMLVAASELIKLAMDVQENTLATAQAANS